MGDRGSAGAQQRALRNGTALGDPWLQCSHRRRTRRGYRLDGVGHLIANIYDFLIMYLPVALVVGDVQVGYVQVCWLFCCPCGLSCLLTFYFSVLRILLP